MIDATQLSGKTGRLL